MKVTIRIVLIAVLISGCQTNPKRVPDLRYGMTYDAVDDAIWGEDAHQFSAAVDGKRVSCYGIEFGHRVGARYYFVFEDDRLVSVVESAPFFEWQVVERDGMKISEQAPWDPEVRMRRIVAATRIPIEQLKIDVATKLDAASKSKDSDMNVLPAFVILLPLFMTAGLYQSASEKRQMNTWAERFDSERVQPGMTREDVHREFGSPVFVMPLTSGETCAYGPLDSIWRKDGQAKLGPSDRRYWVAVVFENGVATRVFSNDLFDERDIGQIEYFVAE